MTPDTYYKYGQTPTDPNDHWYEFLYDGQTGAEIDGNIITLHLTDALKGDDVLIQDSKAIDLGGPAFTLAAEDSEPIAAIINPPSDTTITVGGSIDFQGSVSSGNPPFTYSWDFDGGAENSDLLEPGEVTFDKVGTYTVTFRVTDIDGDISSDTVSITVNESSGDGDSCFIDSLRY
jgi:surface-anchored protein